jgi:hypothetical protein
MVAKAHLYRYDGSTSVFCGFAAGDGLIDSAAEQPKWAGLRAEHASDVPELCEILPRLEMP